MSLLEGGTGKAARHKEETVEGVEECNRMCTKKQDICTCGMWLTVDVAIDDFKLICDDVDMEWGCCCW